MTTSAIIQWIIIVVVLAVAPYTYWRLFTGRAAGVPLRLFSYISVALLAVIVGTVLYGLRLMGMAWIPPLLFTFLILHFFGMRRVTATTSDHDHP